MTEKGAASGRRKTGFERGRGVQGFLGKHHKPHHQRELLICSAGICTEQADCMSICTALVVNVRYYAVLESAAPNRLTVCQVAPAFVASVRYYAGSLALLLRHVTNASCFVNSC